MYSKLTSKTTGLFGATLGRPGAEVRPLGNANYINASHIISGIYKIDA